MPYDLALSEFNDLLFSASRDLLGVSGEALVKQRIRTRLKILRGSWLFDIQNRLGSQLHLLHGAAADDVETRANAVVRDALQTMEDVSVSDVQIDVDGNTLLLNVMFDYTEGESIDSTNDVISTGTLTITVPLGD